MGEISITEGANDRPDGCTITQACLPWRRKLIGVGTGNIVAIASKEGRLCK
jgi:hypothetical protein